MLLILFVFRAGFFNKKMKSARYMLMFFSTELLFKTKLEHDIILMLKAKQMFLKLKTLY